MPQKLNLEGQRFGRLLVTGQVDDNSPGSRIKWDCVCDCGNQVSVQRTHLRSGRTQSCGCLQREFAISTGKDRTGQRFGRLEVVKDSGKRRNRKIIWECLCDCGNAVELSSTSLAVGTVSCGCYRKEVTAKLKYTHGQCGTRAYHQFHTAKRKAAKINRTPQWSDLGLIKQIYDQCPSGLTVDHIIPLQGETVSGLHVPDNLQYLTMRENSGKGNRFKPQFVSR